MPAAEVKIIAEAINCRPYLCIETSLNLIMVDRSLRMAVHKGAGPAAPTRAPPECVERLFHVLAVEGNVQSLPLLFFADAKSHGHVNDLEDDEAHDTTINQRGADAP